MLLVWAITASVLCIGAIAFVIVQRHQQKSNAILAESKQQQSLQAIGEAEAKCQQLESRMQALRAELTMTEDLLQKEASKARAAVKDYENLQRKVSTEYVERLGTAKALSDISHELRTPLNAIMGFAQLLRASVTDESVAHFSDIICQNGQKLIDQIDNIIDMFRINTNSLVIRPSAPCNIDNLMFETYTYFNDLRFNQDKEDVAIRLLNTNDDEPPCILQTDARRLRQVLFCLVDNALKFTDKGEIDFGYTLHPEDHLVQIFVRDTGIGIPEDQYAYIFNPLTQLDHGGKRKSSGLGIGLYLCKQIVEKLGGNIWFESTLGSGTTFFMMLPLERAASNRSDEPKLPKHYNWKGRRILVAEDIRSNFKLIEQVLRDTNVDLAWASNGQEAVKMLNDEQFDFVLMDVKMPVMDGIEATRAIRAAGITIPIVAQTAQEAASNDTHQYIDAGCTGVIEKPFNINRLKELIDLHLSVNEQMLR